MASQRGAVPRPVLLLGGLLHLLLVITVLPDELMWDEAAFLLHSRYVVVGDLAHLLYMPLLIVFRWAVEPFTEAPDLPGRLLSAGASALAFVALWRFVCRSLHAPVWLGGGVASLYATSPVFWQQSVRIEVYTLEIAFLLLAANSAVAFRRRPGIGRAAAALVAWGLCASMHFTAVLALPWLTLLATRDRRTLLKLSLGVAGLVVLIVLGLLVLTPAAFETFVDRVLGYLPSPDEDRTTLDLAQNHIHRLSILFVDGSPVFSLLAGFSLLTVLAWRKKRSRELLLAATLVTPYLAVFLVFGTSFLGLLLPVLISLIYPTVLALRTVKLTTGRSTLVHLALAGILLVQIGWSYRVLSADARIEDPLKIAALRLEAALPDGAFLIAAERSQHLKLWTDVKTYSLPDALHPAHSRGDDLRELLKKLIEVELRGQPEVFITKRAISYLDEVWNIERGTVPVDEESYRLLGRRPRVGIYRVIVGGD